MGDCQYIVRSAGHPERAYDTIHDTARALLDAGSTEPVSVATYTPTGWHERPLTALELRRLGHALREARESAPRATTSGPARLAKALTDLPPNEAA